jgi:MFS family permease
VTGTARDALAHRDFRVVFIGSFVSNIGRWMQNVVLTAFAWELTERPSFVALVVFAQLGPMLLLSLVGGTLADSVDRRRLLLGTQVWQAAWTFVLAAAVVGGEIDEWLLLVIVFIIGLGQAIFAPTWSAALPMLAGPDNLQAAVSLNSTQMNASRVVGPALGGVLWVAIGASGVFVPDDPALPTAEVQLSEIGEFGVASIDIPYLASTNGGPIEIDPEETETLKPADARFAVTADPYALDATDGKAVRGLLKVEGVKESIAARAARQVMRVLIREAGV